MGQIHYPVYYLSHHHLSSSRQFSPFWTRQRKHIYSNSIVDRYIDFSKQKLPFVHETARYLINTKRLFTPVMAYFMDAYICPHIPMSWDGFRTGFLLYYDYHSSDTYKLSVPVDPKMCFLIKPEACMYIFISWIHNEFMKLMFTINYFVHTRANHSQYDPPLMFDSKLK